jgi:hypothetical protein
VLDALALQHVRDDERKIVGRDRSLGVPELHDPLQDLRLLFR